MKRAAVIAGLMAAVLVAMSLTSIASARERNGLDWQGQTNLEACPDGKIVIDVTHKVVHDADSGVTPNSWASDAYTRHIRVVQLKSDPTLFCAVTRYDGKFVTKQGASPQNTDPDGIGAGIKGNLKGGYRSTIFTGVLNPSPAYAKKGNIGSFDYQEGANNWSWTGAYFTSTSGFDLAWWGWQYDTSHNGHWVNACAGAPGCPGSSGDITDDSRICTFTADDSAYYNGMTPAAGLYATGPITIGWDTGDGSNNVTSAAWDERTVGDGVVHYNKAAAGDGNVSGGVGSVHFKRPSPDFNDFTADFTLSADGKTLTGTAQGPYLLTATGKTTCAPKHSEEDDD